MPGRGAMNNRRRTAIRVKDPAAAQRLLREAGFVSFPAGSDAILVDPREAQQASELIQCAAWLRDEEGATR